jgi:two-component system, sensor histidine kinase LadS
MFITIIFKKEIQKFFFLYLLLQSSLSLAQTVNIQEVDTPISIGKNMTLLEDTTSLLKIQEISSATMTTQFKPSQQVTPTYDFIFSAIWSRFTYQNLTGTSSFLQINSAGVDSIDVFVLDSGKNLILEEHLVAIAPLATFELPSATYLIELPISPSLQTVYVRLKCDETLIMDFKIGSLKSFYRENIWSVWFNAIYFGIVLIMVIYNAFIFFSIRDIAYLYYILFGISIGLTFATTLGYTIFLVGDFHWFFKKYPAIPASLATIFGGFFLENALKIKKHLMWGVYVNYTALFNIIIALSGYTHFSSLMTKFFATAPLLIFLYESILIYRKGYKPAKIFLVGFSGFTFFIMLYILIYEGRMFPILRPFSAYFLQIGSAWEIVILSLALAYKITLLKKEKHLSQLENLRLVREQNLMLEGKVKERTVELQVAVDELKQTNEELKQTLEISNRQKQEIETQKEELANLNNLKNKLLSVISHDLRSPIASLKSTVEILNPDMLEKEDLVAIKGDISKKLDGIDYAVNNMLVWAKSQFTEGGGGEPQKQRFAICSIAEEVFGLYYEIAEKKVISLCNYLEKDAQVYADIDQVRTVLRNLVSNAIKFSHQKGKVHIFQNNHHEVSSSFIIIGVRDTGVGMSVSQREKLFKTETHFTTRGTQNEKGTGLGLLLCKEFIEKNGGKIWIESENGKGSTFYFSLPK